MKVRQIRRRAKSKYVSEEGFAFLRGCFAKRCRTYEAGCATCDEWRFYDEHGRFVYNFEELVKYMYQTPEEALIRFAEEYGHEEQEKATQVIVDYINGLYSTGNIKGVEG